MTLKRAVPVASLEISASAHCCDKFGCPPQRQWLAGLGDGVSMCFGLGRECNLSLVGSRGSSGRSSTAFSPQPSLLYLLSSHPSWLCPSQAAHSFPISPCCASPEITLGLHLTCLWHKIGEPCAEGKLSQKLFGGVCWGQDFSSSIRRAQQGTAALAGSALQVSRGKGCFF